jgi:hypothetical protein
MDISSKQLPRLLKASASGKLIAGNKLVRDKEGD